MFGKSEDIRERVAIMNLGAYHSEDFKVWDATKAEELFSRAVGAINDVAQGNFASDNIRVLPFTEKVIERCKTLARV